MFQEANLTDFNISENIIFNKDKGLISETSINNNNNNNNDNDENDNDEHKEIIKQNLMMALDIIPEMTIHTNLIYLNGRINGDNIKIMIDTGASTCVIFKSIIDKYNLNYLVDKSASILVEGVHGSKPTLGTIWCMEIELEISNKEYIYVPITLEVINDYQNKKSEKDFDIILGMTFLKSYRANIDFFSMTLILNKNIKIKFN